MTPSQASASYDPPQSTADFIEASTNREYEQSAADFEKAWGKFAAILVLSCPELTGTAGDGRTALRMRLKAAAREFWLDCVGATFTASERIIDASMQRRREATKAP